MAQRSQTPIPGTQGWSQGLSPIVSCSGSSCSRPGAVWPPSHEPPQPHGPREVHWALLGLPGKQLLFCSLQVLARAVAGSSSISLSTGVGCGHSTELRQAGCSPQSHFPGQLLLLCPRLPLSRARHMNLGVLPCSAAAWAHIQAKQVPSMGMSSPGSLWPKEGLTRG